MANADYRIEAEVSTSNAVKNLRAMRGAASELTSTLRELNRVTAAGEKDLNSYARSVTALLAEQRRAADVQVKLAEARLREAKASGVQQDMNNRIAESRQRQGLIEARTATQTAQAERTRNGIVNDSLRTQSAVEAQSVRNTIAQERLSQATERHGIATRRAAQNQLELTDNLSNTRYLLYDVGATYRTIALGLEAIPLATAAVAVAYQRDFAQVVRVTEGTQAENDALRKSLKDLGDQIPVSFGEMTKIAQLGAQMGVPIAALKDFTEVTAKFTSVSGIAAESASTMFGRLETSFNPDGKIPDFFNKVGSAIAKVGAETVATDPEIASMLNQIAPLGAEAGMTADQVVGLSGALASVRVQPELARGTLTRVFASLNRAADEGAKGMADYARVLGITGQAAADMWKNDPSKFFTSLISKLHDVHTQGGSLTSVFDTLGVKATRDVSALTKLAVGYDVLDKSMKTADQSFKDGTALNDMSKVTFETVAAKLTLMANAFKNLADSLGGGALAPLAGLIGMITDVVKAFDGLVNQVPPLKVLINVLMGFGAVLGVLAGLKAAQAFVLAGMVSMQQSMSSSAAKTLSLSGLMRQLAVTILMSKGASEQQALAMIRNASAMQALGTATSTTNARIAAMSTVSTTAATATVNAASGMGRMASTARNAFGAIGQMVGGLSGLATMAGVVVVGALISMQQHAQDAGNTLGEAISKGANEAMVAAGNLVKETKLKDIGATANFFDETSIANLADRMGMDMNKVVTALSKGKAGVQDFIKELDRIAAARGDNLNLPQMAGTWGSDAVMLRNALSGIADRSEAAASSTKKVDEATKGASKAAADAVGNFEDEDKAIKDLDKALQGLNDTIFGTVNAEAAVGSALNRLGQSLQESHSFGNDEGGRANLDNFEKSLAEAQKYYASLKTSRQLTEQEAAAGYEQFVQDLIARTQAMGGQLGPIEGLALQTVDKFRTTVGADTAANPATVQVTANTAPAKQEVQSAGQQITGWVQAQQFAFQIGVDTSDGNARLTDLANSLSQITGMPFQVVLDALTDPANSKAADVQNYITQIVNGTYVAPIGANIDAAVTNVKNFADYAHQQLADVQRQLNEIATNGQGFFKLAANSALGNQWSGSSWVAPAPVSAPASVPTPSTIPTSTKHTQFMPEMNNVNQGYDKNAEKAEKAGEKGKKAGKDTADAWKDAANGIDQATSAADDFASRLKQGLDRAFERQYGLQIATDEYYKQLNAINKKREDEVKQVDDLLQKVRELKAERDLDLVDAAKARTEQAISIKYGEGARAADYGAQAAKAEEAAASKQKDIEASQKQAAEIQAGIGQLNGYSDAAIANREALRSLEQKQLDMVVAYAKTGASIDEVRNYAAGLNAQFQSDVGQIGFNQTAVQNLTGDLGRYIDVINAIPYVKPTEVKADVGTPAGADGTGGSGALGNLGAFNAAANEATKDRTMTVTVNAQKGIGEAWELITMADGSTERVNRGQSGNIFGPSGYMFRGGIAEGYPTGGIVPGRAPSNPRKDNMLALVDGKRPIGIRSGEGIVTQQATQHYGGAQFIDALNKMRLPRFAMGGVPGGGSGSGGPTAFTLDANSIAQIATAVASMNIEVPVSVDGREIARAASNANRTNNRNGARR